MTMSEPIVLPNFFLKVDKAEFDFLGHSNINKSSFALDV